MPGAQRAVANPEGVQVKNTHERTWKHIRTQACAYEGLYIDEEGMRLLCSAVLASQSTGPLSVNT